jgi:hypothetical protein
VLRRRVAQPQSSALAAGPLVLTSTPLLGSAGWTSRSGGPNAGVDTTPLVKWAQDSNKRNKAAATWSAAAAFFAFLSWGLGLFAHS